MCHEITGLQQMGLKEKNAKTAAGCQCCLLSLRQDGTCPWDTLARLSPG